MKENIKNLSLDIRKCEEALKLNNLLEIVIIIEEMIDKYKNQIMSLSSLEKDNVWLYKKKDLNKLNEYLNEYKNNLINEYKISSFKKVFDDSVSEINSNNYLSIDKKFEVIEIINNIKHISFSDKSREEKWQEIKPYISYITNEEFIIASNLLQLINFVLTNEL